MPEIAIHQMDEIRQIVAHYQLAKDVYNIDESGLFWKATPDRSITTEQLAGRKAEKARITTIHCCNGDGSDRLPLWIIGKAANLRAFGARLVLNQYNQYRCLALVLIGVLRR